MCDRSVELNVLREINLTHCILRGQLAVSLQLASLGDGIGEWESINDDYQPIEESDSDEDDVPEKGDGGEGTIEVLG